MKGLRQFRRCVLFSVLVLALGICIRAFYGTQLCEMWKVEHAAFVLNLSFSVLVSVCAIVIIIAGHIWLRCPYCGRSFIPLCSDDLKGFGESDLGMLWGVFTGSSVRCRHCGAEIETK